MTSREAWAPVFVDDHRCLIYGPRTGRLYLVPHPQAHDQTFLRIIGLSGCDRFDALIDPAQHVALRLSDVNDTQTDDGSVRLRLAYQALSGSRHIAPLRFALKTLSRAAVLNRRRLKTLSVEDIGRRLHAIEQSTKGDCYPRALITAFLSLTAALPCTLAIGTLAPTRKMHAWCSVDGAIPYEPQPEHYLYQPLWTMALRP